MNFCHQGAGFMRGLPGLRATRALILPLLLFAGFLVVACSPDTGPGEAQDSNGTGERTVYIQVVQYDMTRDVARTAFPDTLERYPEFANWPGYRLEPPGEDGKWYARAYAWAPSTVVVNQGETVTLEFFGIHGDEHPSYIEGYDIQFNPKRGEITRVTFTADRVCVFEIRCPAHTPSMTGQLVVLPRG